MRRVASASAAILALTLLGSSTAGGAATDPTAPPTAVTGATSAIAPTSVVVNAVVNPKDTVTTWYFQYGPSSTPGFPLKTATGSAGAGTAGVSIATSLTGLSPSTSYDYRIVAVNKFGTVAGGTGYFNTSAAPTVVTSPASSLTATSGTLNGSIAPQGLATKWYFQYGPTTAYGKRTPTRTLAAGPNTVSVSAPVTDLVAHTEYHFRLVAVSSAGTTKGTDVTFTTGLAVTLNASVTTITYGQYAPLSGTLASGEANRQVTIMAQLYNASAPTILATVTTGANGTWSYTAQPVARTTYTATVSNGSSSAVTISVRPRVTLREVAGRRLRATVTGGVWPFTGHVLQLQRLVGQNWVTWKHVALGRGGQATFSTSLPRGRTAIRMAIGPFVAGIDQAGPGYLAGFSRPMTYVNS